MTTHLNHEQLFDLLLANRSTDGFCPELDRSRQHVRECHICADELASLSRSLTLFRSTANAWANHAWNHQAAYVNRSLLPATSDTSVFSRFRLILRPAAWSTAAVAIALAVAVPMTLHRLSKSAEAPAAAVTMPPASPAETRAAAYDARSDEALLEEVNQTLSSSVPSPMQPLADPTASSNNQSNNATRKN